MLGDVGRVYQLAKYLAEQEGADNFIVGMPALLHDLGRTVSHHATSITLISPPALPQL